MRNPELYGKRGVTYTERTTSNLSARVLNEGSCFSVPGPGIIPKDPTHLHFLLAYINSFAAGYAIEALIGGGDFSIKGTAARHLEPGYMKHLPEVVVSADDAALFSDRVNALLRLLETVVSDETDPLFKRLQIQPTESLSKSLERSTREAFERFQLAYGIIEGLEQKITTLLQIPDDRIRDTYSDTGWPWAQGRILPAVDHSVILSVDPFSPRSGVRAGDFGPSNHRFQMKLSHYLHAGIERYAAFRKVSPIAVCELLTKRAVTSRSAVVESAAAAISYLFGAVFGRWDIRYAIGDIQWPGSADPFAPLPVCPPGMLQTDDGLPLSPEAGCRLRTEGQYPLDIAWDGILVEDPEHPLDFERQVRAAFAVLWTEDADTVEREACELLGVPSLREWFRRPACFFADHLTRYSKSRRQAPIYWPISSPSGTYTLWLYYHRLTPDTLYKCLQQFVVPKLADVEKELSRLRKVLAANEGGTKERERLADLEDLRRELIELSSELELWAPRWKPNLNDGVLITAAPLWKLFRLPKWRNDLKACWQEMEKGDYNWSHLAYSLWPDHIREKCRTDRSLAIAHGLEDLCEVKETVKKKKKSKQSKMKCDLQESLED
jgi:hypothetical protein